MNVLGVVTISDLGKWFSYKAIKAWDNRILVKGLRREQAQGSIFSRLAWSFDGVRSMKYV
jgi:hypothetical protein